jgi:hypothetical protein
MSDVLPVLLTEETAGLVEFYKEVLKQGLTYKSANIIVRKLGCTVKDQKTEFGFWYPGLKKVRKAEIEFFSPVEPFHFNKGEQHVDFHHWRLPLTVVNEFAVGVFEGLQAGDEEQFGVLYRYRISDRNGNSSICYDPMASSMPYGLHAPAEIYDLERIQNTRNDLEYYRNLDVSKSGRIKPSANILEIHVPTATSEGSLQSLAKLFQSVAYKIKNDESLTPFEEHLTGFDAVELMPIEPVAQLTKNQDYWSIVSYSGDKSTATVHVKRPDVLNWGYDVTVFGSAAINASLLSNGRPDELKKLTETLHNFPGKPVKIILDIVMGHAEERASELLPDECFTEGKNNYGLCLNYKHPLFRAMLLEMQRRKTNWGLDGVRVDASHDFKNYDPEANTYRQDDKFLDEMSEVEQSVAGRVYKSWMIYEDGRPWPDKDWLIAASFRDLINRQEEAYQWGPLTFSHNKPYTYGFWISNWWRIEEICSTGARWITGISNHDTVRKVVHEKPDEKIINRNIGDSPHKILLNAYNNPAGSLLFQGFLPGVPMEFLNSLSASPWCFFRNTDEFKDSLKVIVDEAFFLTWQAEGQDFGSNRFFLNLKHLGFNSLWVLRKFMERVNTYLQITGDEIDEVVNHLNLGEIKPADGEWTTDKLKEFTEAWILDICDYCNINNHIDSIQADYAKFYAKLRRFRQDNSWLQNNFTDKDKLNFITPLQGSVICYGYREDPLSGRLYIIVANLEGRGRVIRLKELDLPVKEINKWKPLIQTPGLKVVNFQDSIRLQTSQGIIISCDKF